MTPSEVVWRASGSPAISVCRALDVPTVCYVCGGLATRGQGCKEWMGGSFTSQTVVRAPWSLWVCEPCVFVMSRTSPVPGRPPKPGKSLGGNFRNYSHLWCEAAGYSNASKGEKPLILSFLRAPKRGRWFAAIADSGQKHVLPFARMGGVRFEEADVALPRDAAGWAVVDDLSALLTAGATKDEIARGVYEARAYQLARDKIEAFERAHSGLRGGAWFDLALWLAQRDEEMVAIRLAAEKEMKRGRGKGGSQGRDGAVPGVGADGVPSRRREPAEALGADPVTDARRDPAEFDGGGVGNERHAGLATPAPVQLGLFGP